MILIDFNSFVWPFLFVVIGAIGLWVVGTVVVFLVEVMKNLQRSFDDWRRWGPKSGWYK